MFYIIASCFSIQYSNKIFSKFLWELQVLYDKQLYSIFQQPYIYNLILCQSKLKCSKSKNNPLRDIQLVHMKFSIWDNLECKNHSFFKLFRSYLKDSTSKRIQIDFTFKEKDEKIQIAFFSSSQVGIKSIDINLDAQFCK